MWIFDLSSGVSKIIILKAFLLIEGNNNFILDELGEDFFLYKEIKFILNSNLPIDTKILELKEKLEKFTPLTKEEILKKNGRYFNILHDIINLSQESALDFFSYFIYLTLIIFFDKYNNRKDIFFSIPKIGFESSTISINLLKNKKINIALDALPIEELLAALFNKYVESFVDNLSIEIIDSFEVIDPINPNIKIRIWKCLDNFNHVNTDIITVLETNIDDTTPEILASAMEHILKCGALDYVIIPVSMKKNRSGFYIQILCKQKDTDYIANKLFKWTSTFGIRKTNVNRIILDRNIEVIETSFGKVRIKKGILDNKIIRISPEFDDIIKISRETGYSTQNIYTLICKELKINLDSN